MVAMQSAAATASVKVRNSLDFFMGAVLLFKVRDRGRGRLQRAAAHKGGELLRGHVEAAHKLDDLQVFLFGLGRFQLPKLLLQLRDLALGFLNILSMRSNLFIAIVIYSFLAFKATARNNKNAAASSLN